MCICESKKEERYNKSKGFDLDLILRNGRYKQGNEGLGLIMV